MKGRDWYDFEWYIRNNVPLNFEHLSIRIKEFNGLELTKEQFQSLLKDKLAKTDVDLVKKDVLPFVKNRSELDIWSNDYFLMLVNRICYQ